MAKHAKPSPQLKRKLAEQLAAEKKATRNVVRLDDWKRRAPNLKIVGGTDA